MTENAEQLQWLLASIETGSHDDALDAIVSAVERRRSVLSRRLARSLRPGDTVRFATVKPKYLIGLTATVNKTTATHVWVSCPDTPKYRRYAGSTDVCCRIELIERA